MNEQELGDNTTQLGAHDIQSVINGSFYAPPPSIGGLQQKREGKPAHYKVICISMYTDDLRRLDTMVEALKARGLTKANRSALIRYALGQVDLDRVPKGL